MIVGRFDERSKEVVTHYGSTGTTIRWLIDKEHGAQTFAMRRFEVQPKGEIPLHDHDADHEIYVLSGKGLAFTAEQEVAIEADMFLYIPPNEPHGYRTVGEDPLVFLCVIPLKTTT